MYFSRPEGGFFPPNELSTGFVSEDLILVYVLQLISSLRIWEVKLTYLSLGFFTTNWE